MSNETTDVGFYEAVYGVLVEHAGASGYDDDRSQFVRVHTGHAVCTEFRFMGSLGFGGKYRSETSTVDCYPEDLTDERRKIIQKTNAVLWTLKAKRKAGTG